MARLGWSERSVKAWIDICGPTFTQPVPDRHDVLAHAEWREWAMRRPVRMG